MNKFETQIQINKLRATARGAIKKILFKTKCKLSNCEGCGVGEIYNEKPLTLQLHHIDGNGFNNDIDNLQILCPNCHSQTSNFRSKKPISKEKILEVAKNCKSIGQIIDKLQKYPSWNLYKKIEKIIIEENLPIKKYNFEASARANISRTKHTSITRKRINCPTCLEVFEPKTKHSVFCSKKCVRSHKCEQFNYEEALNQIKEFGWVQAAKNLGMSGQTPDVKLRMRIKRYIKREKLNINFYELTKFQKHASKKEVAGVGLEPTRGVLLTSS